MAPVIGSNRQQANALLLKSFIVQKRSWATNICLVSAPILFCGLLAVLELVVNNLLQNNVQNKVMSLWLLRTYLLAPYSCRMPYIFPLLTVYQGSSSNSACCGRFAADLQCGCQCLSCCVPYREQIPWTQEQMEQLASGVQVRAACVLLVQGATPQILGEQALVGS